MTDKTDSQLLHDYAESRSETAFAELVRRHVDFVYSAARRMVCDSHLAEDVSQAVFVALAKDAAKLLDRPVLSGWLHRTAQNIAAQTVRTDVRRRAREQEAAMNQSLSSETDAPWDQVAPHLDTMLGELNEPDRDALLLRYFERKSAQEMAQPLGISAEAAQKRVSRAVERLRELFAQRGIAVGASGLVVVISTNSVQAAPVGLQAAITTSLATKTILTATATKAIAMTTLQKTLIAVGVAVFLTAATGVTIRQMSTRRNPPTQAFSVTNHFIMKWGQTAISAGDRTSSGERSLVCVTPMLAPEPSSVTMKVQVIKLNKKNRAVTSPVGVNGVNMIMNTDVFTAFLTNIQRSGPSTISDLEMQTSSGRRATLGMASDLKQPKVVTEIFLLPTISADGQTVSLDFSSKNVGGK